MSSTAYQVSAIHPYRSSADSAELFPESVTAAFDRLEAILRSGRPNEPKPSDDTVAWAKLVLLRVLPRNYLLGAEIDAFQSEIHVNWEHGRKRVTVFLPAQDQLKIYCEQETDQGVEHHLRLTGNDPWEVSGALGWLFA